MELQLVTFEQAKALKELGFPQGECWNSYLENIEGEGYLMDKDSYTYSAPTLELAAKWLRDEKNIFILINCILPQYEITMKWKSILFNLPNVSFPLGVIADTLSDLYNTYEEALSGGIDKAIEILKNV